MASEKYVSLIQEKAAALRERAKASRTLARIDMELSTDAPSDDNADKYLNYSRRSADDALTDRKASRGRKRSPISSLRDPL